ncbi:MAG TPA: sodium-translocating pyrophosphatase, partial [Myxococcales bacterium]|nr:sodium-translocating pyrophosphatase [Myxococcales bacterium]
NVGDNVGDCAGMAADIFESYEVTIVAAMILGLASFGHKGVIFPLLVRGIGVVGSIISTYTVKAGPNDTSDTALKSVHRGFWIGSVISITGFMVLGFFYLRFDAAYLQGNPVALPGFPNGNPAELPVWANLGVAGLDMRPALTCLIGVILAIMLNKITSYYTHTKFTPVQELAKSCQTGHATNIISGFALGYESTVMTLMIIVGAMMLAVVTYMGTPPMFVAYGVAMAGIGMLTLTGNTISMDVFGPVADNANGIGEMGYDKEQMEKDDPGSYKRARQILADLDAVGNTTKAETKGIAIGSAVIAAFSLFSSFIATIAVGGEDKIHLMTEAMYHKEAGLITVADPVVLVGLLIGGAVPFLFSSMLIRAVGRAAFYIVKECRQQFRDKEILAGTKKPEYGRVVDICTVTAQKELIGPGLMAVVVPVAVGFGLGPYALGGFLAGTILAGQLLAVFMANAGGAWDNAKKLIEDGVYGGKGSEAHKAAITGDTVGDPLKDTAGPAINPLIKVMNMVSLLVLGPALAYNMAAPRAPVEWARWVGVVVFLVSVGSIVWAVLQSKREAPGLEPEAEPAGTPPVAGASS